MSGVQTASEAAATPELVTTTTGRPAWQINTHAAVKALSRDPRLADVSPMLTPAPGRPRPPTDSETESDSIGWARVLRRAFSPERIDALADQVDSIVDNLLADIAAGRRAPDLHHDFAVPLVAHVTCALLDVPQGDGLRFRAWWDQVKTGTRVEAAAGQAAILRYVRELYASRVAEPEHDLTSAIVTGQPPHLPYTDRAIKFLTSLVSKGRETPANALDCGVVLLLRDPREFDSLVREPGLIEPAVDEILRLFPVISGKVQGPEGIRRFALSDFHLGATAVRRGDLVLLNVVAANMDPEVFVDAERLDLRREPNPHLTFGYGPHACPASRLARMEMSAAVTGLVRRFPTLRLAVDAADLRFRERTTSEGFEALPVTW